VERILAFAERILPRAADLWVQASLEQRQWFQQLFSAFSDLRPIEDGKEVLVDQTGASWNHLSLCLRRLASMRKAF
jgi:hypothetical protein